MSLQCPLPGQIIGADNGEFYLKAVGLTDILPDVAEYAPGGHSSITIGTG